MDLLLIVLLPIIGALLPPLAIRFGRSASAWTAMAVTAVSLTLALEPLRAVFSGAPVAAHWAWLPQAGLDIQLRMDGLAALFVMLILGIGLLVILYARYYLSERDPMGRFYGMLLLLSLIHI